MRQSLREISFEIKRQLYTGLKGWKYFPDSVAVAWWLDGTESWISARSRQRTCAKMFRMAEHFGMPEGLEFALIPPGRKVLNCSVNDSVAVNLVVSEPFYLSVRPMSVLQCKKMFGYGEPASIDEGEGDHRRVAVDPWLEVRSTIRWLNSRYGELGFRFWLPTEQEWEYVSSVAFSANAGSAEMINSEVGVGAESAVVTNALGIVFLYGSVWEWCSEMFEGDQSGLQQPRQESTGVLRGMTWSGTEVPCRSARRYTMDCVSRPSDVRFRIACVPHALDGK
jgi:hypothetical protein